MRANWFEWRRASLADRAYCRALIQEGSRSFHAASILLPKRLRDPAYAIYAFCRVADDAVDDENAHVDATDRLRLRLDHAYDDRPIDNPCDRALADVAWQYDIPKPLFEALIEGLDWDQDGRSYETIECLHAYAARVASAVGSIMTCLMGRKDPETVARACDLGVAMQLTNIARDVGEDARNGRVYLPHAWLREVGIKPEDLIANPKMSPELASVIQRLLAHADRLYRQSLIGIGRLPRNCRPSINSAGEFMPRSAMKSLQTATTQSIIAPMFRHHANFGSHVLPPSNAISRVARDQKFKSVKQNFWSTPYLTMSMHAIPTSPTRQPVPNG